MSNHGAPLLCYSDTDTKEIMQKLLKSVVLLASLSTFTACAQPLTENSTPNKLVLAGVPLDGSTEITDSYQLIADQLSKELDIPVELFEASDPVAIQAAFAAGKVDLASYAGLDYWVQRKLTKELEIVAVSTKGEDVPPGNFAFGYVKADDKSINGLKDLKGKTVCFSEKTGGGYMAPGYELALVGLAPSEDGVNGVTSNFTGSAAASFYAVKNKSCDALFTIQTTVKSVFDANKDLKESEFRQFHTSITVPGSGLIVSTRLGEELRAKIKAIAVNHLNKTYFVEQGICQDESSCKLLNKSNWGYVESPANYYEPILKFCRVLDPLNCPEE